jgi:hypothetical protein
MKIEIVATGVPQNELRAYCDESRNQNDGCACRALTAEAGRAPYLMSAAF